MSAALKGQTYGRTNQCAATRRKLLPNRSRPHMADAAEKVRSLGSFQNRLNDIDTFDRLRWPLQIHSELATFVGPQKIRSPASMF